MKRERLFYLDFIRAIACVTILLTHYNAHYMFYYMNPPMEENAILTIYPFHVYIGTVGVSLFFIISGAALMYVYQEKCELKSYYKKRFLSLYPMFWIAYIIGFLYLFYQEKQMIFTGIPKPYFLLTILGMDGYLTGAVPVFYILGEWFLGCIILMYLIFPLLRKLMISHPVILWIVAIALFIPAASREWIPNFVSSKLIFSHIPELLFGMSFVYSIKKVRPWMALAALIVLVCQQIIYPQIPENIMGVYIGISLFLVLVFISGLFDRPMFQGICGTIGKYSYAIFLTHHVVIDELAKRIPMENLNRSGRYVMFLLYICITAVLAKLLYMLHGSIMRAIRNNPWKKTSEVSK